jgi:hypothetical protein
MNEWTVARLFLMEKVVHKKAPSFYDEGQSCHADKQINISIQPTDFSLKIL